MCYQCLTCAAEHLETYCSCVGKGDMGFTAAFAVKLPLTVLVATSEMYLLLTV